MPLYATRCGTCREKKDVRLTFSEYDEVKTGARQLACSECGADSSIEFAPGTLGFVMKDGESGGWASKALKENAFRAKRATTMARREKDHVFKPRLVPNYKGDEAPTWKEAQEAARTVTTKELGPEAGDAVASTYEPLVSGGTP